MSQVRILAPRLTFPNEFPSPPGSWGSELVGKRCPLVFETSSEPSGLSWEGPIPKDGFTKVGATWDGESQRWLTPEVLATNGITNAQAEGVFIAIAGRALAEALGGQGN
jgi:hypothetical protein